MEIGLTRIGDVQILTVKGRIRLENWRVVDKHMDTMLEKGCRSLVVDLSEVTLICSTGIGALFHNVKKFEDRQGRLMLISAKPYLHELLESFAGEPFLAEHVFPDWKAVEKVLDPPERTDPPAPPP